MELTVDLHSQFQRLTVEIEDVRPDRMLLAEVQAVQLASLQAKP